MAFMSVPGQTRPKAPAVDRLSLLRNHPLFHEFTPAVLDQLAARMKRQTARRGTNIFAKGDPGIGLLGVLAGNVKISVLSTDGRELVLNIIHPGEIFGEISLLDGHPRTADAIALSDCDLILIERRDFLPLLRDQPSIALKFIEILCSRLRGTSGQLEDTVFLNLPSRLAKTLLHLNGNREKSDPTRKIPITQRDISQIIGVSREGTNKQLRAWVKRKWVRLERGSVTILNPEALEEIAEQGLQSDLL
jgi:CRP-like cAMP-binding protein